MSFYQFHRWNNEIAIPLFSTVVIYYCELFQSLFFCYFVMLFLLLDRVNCSSICLCGLIHRTLFHCPVSRQRWIRHSNNQHFQILLLPFANCQKKPVNFQNTNKFHSLHCLFYCSYRSIQTMS